MYRTILSILLVLFCALPVCSEEVCCDVLVVGGGTSGVVAAVQAGRLKAKTILVEAGAIMGGQATVGGVNSPILFFREGRQCIRGIGWEWMARTVELDNHELPKPEKDGYGYRINASVFAIMAEVMLKEAGVEIRYWEAPSKVESIPVTAQNPYNWLVTTAAMGELRTIRCKQIIDATGSGTVCVMTGAERLPREAIMPGSLVFHIVTTCKKMPEKDVVNACYQEALKSGKLQKMDCPIDPMLLIKSQWQTYITNADNSSAQTRTDTNLRAREAVLRVLLFLKSIPGIDDARLVSMNHEVGIRETHRIKTEHVITEEEYCSGKVWDDSVCYSSFHVDLHRNNAWDAVHRDIVKGKTATIPLRALIPLGKNNILVVGKALGSDRMANSGLRVQSVCMATGQAAGAVCALAAQRNCSLKEIKIDELKSVLKKFDAIVP